MNVVHQIATFGAVVLVGCFAAERYGAARGGVEEQVWYCESFPLDRSMVERIWQTTYDPLAEADVIDTEACFRELLDELGAPMPPGATVGELVGRYSVAVTSTADHLDLLRGIFWSEPEWVQLLITHRLYAVPDGVADEIVGWGGSAGLAELLAGTGVDLIGMNAVVTRSGKIVRTSVSGGGLDEDAEMISAFAVDPVLYDDGQTIDANLQIKGVSGYEVATAMTLSDGREVTAAVLGRDRERGKTLVATVTADVIGWSYADIDGTLVRHLIKEPVIGDRVDPTQLFRMKVRVSHELLDGSPATSGSGLDADPFAPGAQPTNRVTSKKTAKEVLEELGIIFGAGTSAYFDHKNSVLVVVNTSANLDLLESYILDVLWTPTEVVEAKLEVFDVPLSMGGEVRALAVAEPFGDALRDYLVEEGVGCETLMARTRSGMEAEVRSANLEWVVDPVIGADGTTIDIESAVIDRGVAEVGRADLAQSLRAADGHPIFAGAYTVTPNGERSAMLRVLLMSASKVRVDEGPEPWSMIGEREPVGE